MIYAFSFLASTTQERHVCSDCRLSISFPLRMYTSLAGPGAPTDVSVQAQSCHTLKVTWSSPDHTGGLPITRYNISYTDTRTNIMLYEYSNTTMISLQQLKPGTTYIVRVRAMNAIGEGDLTQRSRRTSQRGSLVQVAHIYEHTYIQNTLPHFINNLLVYTMCAVCVDLVFCHFNHVTWKISKVLHFVTALLHR